jgi:hypothetical protein
MTPVIADAEYNPQVSTTYAERGMTASIMLKPSKAKDTSSTITGSFFSATQP